MPDNYVEDLKEDLHNRVLEYIKRHCKKGGQANAE